MDETIRAGMDKAGLPSARRHLFLCLGPDCCSPETGEAVWAHMKARLRDHKVAAMRTKAACLRVCSGGPWLVVYPEGTWYGRVNAERFDRILEEHLVGGRPVEEWVEARNCLDGTGGTCGAE